MLANRRSLNISMRLGAVQTRLCPVARPITRMLSSKKATSQVICPRSQDYSAWYNDVLRQSDMVDDSPVRGCVILKPWAMGTWELIRDSLDKQFKQRGIGNAYFPLFIPQSYISQEAQHVEGFAKECAVVTHHRLHKDPLSGNIVPDPDAQLVEPLVVRPTSETVIWSTFSKWIQSYRDLPLLINQWANVVRWEMRPRPFLRTSEFLWQEGHTAHATREDALVTAREMLGVYAEVCEKELALPTIQGMKSSSERFAGAVETFTIEACMQNGWALQCGTSHFLGQNFSKAFNVRFSTDANTGRLEHAWGTSWGVSTRLMGALVMTHADDGGLVLPPRVSPIQVVILPICKKRGKNKDGATKLSESDRNVEDVANHLCESLKAMGIRCKVDTREYSTLGVLRYEWDRKGVPLRMEIGARDIASGTVSVTTRFDMSSQNLPLPAAGSEEAKGFARDIQSKLDSIQTSMYNSSLERLQRRMLKINSYEEMKAILNNSIDNASECGTNNKLGLFVVPWKDNAENELLIKEECKATIRCFPDSDNQTPPAIGVRCFFSGEQATHTAIFARAF